MMYVGDACLHLGPVRFLCLKKLMLSKYFSIDYSNRLRGDSAGAQANRYFNVNSPSTLVAEHKLMISCNQIHKRHPEVSRTYARAYEKWMDRAVSDLLNKFLQTEYFTFFPVGDTLAFDIDLVGTSGLKKKVTVSLDVGDCSAEMFIDTFVHDEGVWQALTIDKPTKKEKCENDDDLYVYES